MARAQEAKPAGDPESRLLAAVDRQESVAEFCRAVAKKTGRTPDAEESAFYRIIRGRTGAKTAWRIRIYAEILNQDASEFLRPSEQRATEAAENGSEILLTLPGLANALVELTGRVEGLVQRVADLERQAPAKKQRAGRSG